MSNLRMLLLQAPKCLLFDVHPLSGHCCQILRAPRATSHHAGATTQTALPPRVFAHLSCPCGRKTASRSSSGNMWKWPSTKALMTMWAAILWRLDLRYVRWSQSFPSCALQRWRCLMCTPAVCISIAFLGTCLCPTGIHHWNPLKSLVTMRKEAYFILRANKGSCVSYDTVKK